MNCPSRKNKSGLICVLMISLMVGGAAFLQAQEAPNRVAPAEPDPFAAQGQADYFSQMKKPEGQYIIGEKLIIVIAKDHKTVWGYSPATGKWNSKKVHKPNGEKVVPMIGGNMACFQAGDRLYGFSGTTGYWASQAVDDGEKVALSLYDEFALGIIGTRYYTFSRTTGSWDMLDTKLP
ncbi:Hypothetical protein PBC10988_28610 [Planctomycetales bacterium 10988]|nr:Hypothetical protein PBC10988_28610 [Planctomycetales bacterium 10988]